MRNHIQPLEHRRLLSATIYVDVHAMAGGAGHSWANAFTSLQDALASASGGDVIHVAQGTYVATGSGRDSTFALRSNVLVQGGYAGVNSATPEDRNLMVYPTVLSGGASDYHVVTGGGMVFAAGLDGLTITAGLADGTGTLNYGAGFYALGGSYTFTDCAFTANLTAYAPVGQNQTTSGFSTRGGGLYLENATASLTRCAITHNSACFGGGLYALGGTLGLADCTISFNNATIAGGVQADGASLTATGSTFSHNFVTDAITPGFSSIFHSSTGALGIDTASASISACTFNLNAGGYGAGGLALGNSTCAIDRSVFSGNLGGSPAIYASGATANTLTVTNSVLVGNSGAIQAVNEPLSVTNSTFSANLVSGGTAVLLTNNAVTIANSILYGNGNTGPVLGTSTTDGHYLVSYSDVEGGSPGTGNIDADPLFRTPANAMTNGDLRLRYGSPAIDTGNAAALTSPGALSDLDGNPRAVALLGGTGAPDLGAYEALPATHLTLSTAPRASYTAGEFLTIAFTLKNANDETVIAPGNLSVALATAPAGAMLAGTTTVPFSGGTAGFDDILTTTAGTYTLSGSVNAFITPATTPSYAVTPGAASVVSATVPTGVVAGAPFTVTVGLHDAYGNVAIPSDVHATLALQSGPGTTPLVSGTLTANFVSGTATFSGLSATVSGSYVLELHAPSLLGTTTLPPVSIAAATPTSLHLVNPPSTATAGTLPDLHVQLVDPFGNVNTTSDETVTLSASGPGALTGQTSLLSTAGNATFTNATLTASGGYALTFTATGLSPAVLTFFGVNPAAPAMVRIVSPPTSATAGTLPNLHAQLVDTFGNVNTTSDTNITLSTSGPGALTGQTSLLSTAGNATFTSATLTASGQYALTFSATGLAPAVLTFFGVNPAAPAMVRLLSPPASATAGALPTIFADVEDAFGNRVTTNFNTLTLKVALNGQTTTLATADTVTGFATFTALTFTAAGSTTLSVSALSLTSATSPLTISPASPATVAITAQPATSPAGVSFALSAQALDLYGNVETTNASTFALATDGTATPLSGTTTISGTGVVTFSNLMLTTAGTYHLRVSVPGATDALSADLVITPGAATQLIFEAPPVASLSTASALTVDVTDAFGNVLTSDTGRAIALSTTSGPGALAPHAAITTTGGRALFANLTYSRSGTYTLQASADGLTAASTPLVVAAASGPRLFFATAPTALAAGAKSAPVTIQVQDATGAPLTTDKSKVQLFLSSAPSKPLATLTAKNGLATLKSVTLKTAGTFALSATSAGKLSTSSSLVVTPGAVASLTVSAPPTGTINTPFAITVQQLDKFKNILTTGLATPTLKLASSPKGSVLADSTSPFSAVRVSLAGKYTFTATLGKLKATSKALVAH